MVGAEDDVGEQVLRMTRTEGAEAAADQMGSAADAAGEGVRPAARRGRRGVFFGLLTLLAAGAAVFAALRKWQTPPADPWAVAEQDYPDLSKPYSPPIPAHRADPPPEPAKPPDPA
jgi:hypothetical protein